MSRLRSPVTFGRRCIRPLFADVSAVQAFATGRTRVRLEPNWQVLPSNLPPAVRTLLQSALVKDRRQRVADISTARFVLDNVASCTHRDVLPFAGKEEFKPDSWCPECAFYKLRRTPKKRERSTTVID